MRYLTRSQCSVKGMQDWHDVVWFGGPNNSVGRILVLHPLEAGCLIPVYTIEQGIDVV